MAVTHAVIRQTPRHVQAQMAWIILHHWAERWGSGMFSLLLSSNFPNVEILNTLESLDEL
jgi:hypothetical protein